MKKKIELALLPDCHHKFSADTWSFLLFADISKFHWKKKLFHWKFCFSIEKNVFFYIKKRREMKIEILRPSNWVAFVIQFFSSALHRNFFRSAREKIQKSFQQAFSALSRPRSPKASSFSPHQALLLVFRTCPWTEFKYVWLLNESDTENDLHNYAMFTRKRTIISLETDATEPEWF